VFGDAAAAAEVVAADRDAGLVGHHRAPAHQFGAARAQLFEPAGVGQVIAVTQQDDAVGLLALGEVGVPVARKLLERDQQVVTMSRTGPRDRTQHRQEERIDVRIVGRRIFEEQQRERAGEPAAQARRALVHRVVERRRRRFHPPAGFLAHRRVAAQRARYRGLGDPGLLGDVERGDAFLAVHAWAAFGTSLGKSRGRMIAGSDASQIHAMLPRARAHRANPACLRAPRRGFRARTSVRTAARATQRMRTRRTKVAG